MDQVLLTDTRIEMSLCTHEYAKLLPAYSLWHLQFLKMGVSLCSPDLSTTSRLALNDGPPPSACQVLEL